MCVDLRQIKFGQSLVHEAITFQPGRQARELNVFFQIDADVIGLPAFGHLSVSDIGHE